MPKLRYAVLTAGGTRKEVAVDAPDDAAARRRLRRQGLIVVRALGESAGKAGRFRLRRTPRFDVYIFTSRLSPLLAAGIPLEHGLAVLEEGGREEERNVVQRLRRGLHEGKKFSQLTREMPECFPPLFSGLIETGEESGCLPEVTRELRRFLKESKEFREFVLTSSIYPSIVVSVTLLVIVLLFTVFIPRFAKIFEELGREMPFLTRTMLGVGNFMQSVWWIWPLLIFGLVLLYRKSRRPGRLKTAKDRLLLRLPLLGGIITAIQSGAALKAPTKTIPYFDFVVPTELPGVDPAILDPRDTYANPADWDAKAKDLAERFIKNFHKYENNEAGKALVAAGPKL